MLDYSTAEVTEKNKGGSVRNSYFSFHFVVLSLFGASNGIESSSLALLRSAANNNDKRDEKSWYVVLRGGIGLVSVGHNACGV